MAYGILKDKESKSSGCLRQGCLLAILIAVFIFIIIPLINNTGNESTDNGTSETGLTEPTDTTPTETVEPLPEQTEESGLPTVEETETGLLEDIQKAPSSEDFIIRDYSWPYGGKEWTWELSINQSMYDYFKEVPRPPTMNYSVYVTNPQDDPYIDSLVEDINEATAEENYSEYQIVEFAIAFVQNLPYTVDSATSPFDEYLRYPVETLVDNGGDCEDTSILLASILNSMGYGVILIEFPEHCAVGVKGSGNSAFGGLTTRKRSSGYLENFISLRSSDGFLITSWPLTEVLLINTASYICLAERTIIFPSSRSRESILLLIYQFI